MTFYNEEPIKIIVLFSICKEKFWKNWRAELARFSNEPIATIQFIDSKRLRIYGENSIYGVSLKKMGLKNAAPKEFTFNLWGIATVPITSLFKLPKNSRLVIVEPNPLDVKRELKFNGLFRALGFFENSILADCSRFSYTSLYWNKRFKFVP